MSIDEDVNEVEVKDEVNIMMKEINKKLDKILELLETDCKKMSNHIDFVETVYDTVKTPFNFIMNSVSNIVPERYQLK